MNRAIRLISLVLQISIICVCVRHVNSVRFSIHTLGEYNELLQNKFESINNYLQANLIDLNSLNSYLNKLNDYLSYYALINDKPEISRSDVCLLNRTDVCWHIDDAMNIIDKKSSEKRAPTFEWLTNAAYQLNNMNLNQLHPLGSSINSLSSFNLNSTLDSTIDCLKNLTSLNGLRNGFSRFTNLGSLSASLTNTFTMGNLNINRPLFISYFDKFDNEELKNLLVSFNLFMPFVCSAFLFLLCIQNQHRRKLIELNQLFRKIECVTGLQQIKEDMRALAHVIDELKLDAKQNQELKIKLQKMLNNEFKMKQANKSHHHLDQVDVNDNMIKSTKGDQDPISVTFTEQIGLINQQLKLNQLEQSKLKYMVCKTIESFDRILNKMKNNCELINN